MAEPAEGQPPVPEGGDAAEPLQQEPHEQTEKAEGETPEVKKEEEGENPDEKKSEGEENQEGEQKEEGNQEEKHPEEEQPEGERPEGEQPEGEHQEGEQPKGEPQDGHPETEPEKTDAVEEQPEGEERTDKEAVEKTAPEGEDKGESKVETLAELMLEAAKEFETDDGDVAESGAKPRPATLPDESAASSKGKTEETEGECEEEETEESEEEDQDEKDDSASGSWATEASEEDSSDSDKERFVKFGSDYINVKTFEDTYVGWSRKQLIAKFDYYVKKLDIEVQRNHKLSEMVAPYLDVKEAASKEKRKNRKPTLGDFHYECALIDFDKTTKKMYHTCKKMAFEAMKLEEDAKEAQKNFDNKRKEFFDALTSIADKAKPAEGARLHKSISKAKEYEKKASEAREKCIHKELEYEMLKRELEMWQTGGEFDFAGLEALEKETRNLIEKLDFQKANVIKLRRQMMESGQTLAHLRMKKDSDIKESIRAKGKTVELKKQIAETWELLNKTRLARQKLEERMKEMKTDDGMHKYPLLVEHFKKLNKRILEARKEIEGLTNEIDPMQERRSENEKPKTTKTCQKKKVKLCL